jgi:hypothetical protein
MADLTGMLQAAAGAVGGEYEIERSLRFNSADSAYLNRTPASASNRKTFTWSFWMKRTAINGSGSYPTIYSAGSSGNPRMTVDMNASASGDISIGFNNTGSSWAIVSTNALLRDFSAWYHIVIACDLNQGTDSNRVKIYVNGTQQTLTGTYPPNSDSPVNNTVAQNIGRFAPDSNEFLNAYLTEINFIDGQALTPSSFGEINADTGVWSPIRYTGTYGTNGFYLNFSDNSGTTSTTLGKDYSPNGNNWTPNNFSVTAGAGNDSLVDSPTRYGTDTGAGGEVRGNYCTWNPVGSVDATLTNGNLDSAVGSASDRAARGTIAPDSGKWYYEVLCVSTTGVPSIGYGSTTNATSGGTPGVGVTYGSDGRIFKNGSSLGTYSTFTTNDIIGVSFDASSREVKFYKNNSLIETTTLDSGKLYAPLMMTTSGTSGTPAMSANFGQRPFAYTAPSGFKALVTTNLPAGTITTSGTFTGNGSTDGPFVYLNGVPTAMTIGGNAVTFGTDADKLSNGFKIRSSSSTYNQNATSMSYSITSTGDKFKFALAQPNP